MDHNGPNTDRAFLAGGGEMGALIRSLDWSKTPLGPVESWSPTLRTMVRILLVNRFPLLLWWGPRYIQLYNDAYRPIPGAKHPKSLGQPASECWPEIWHIIGPLIDTPFHGGPATWMEDIFLEPNRHGFVEETHFTIAYSPVPDEAAPGGIGGVLGTVHEITEKVVGERRMAALRDLASRPAEAKTAEEACEVAASTLEAHSKDVPFALLYLMDADGKHARLAGAAGVPKGEAISPTAIEFDAANDSAWPLAEMMQTEQLQIVSDLGRRFPSLPPGPWSDPPHTAVLLPIRSTKAHELAGFLVAGISARLRFDDAHRGFLELATAQIATAIANARSFEEEKKRAEALAELDRAKTAFFSNISHEFRTPLTLMLGPVEDILAKPEGAVLPEDRESLSVVNRNGQRLLRLVNTLLDFSRIEAGRVRAVYQPTDLATYTADLASVFRSAIERAGLRLVVDCPPLAEPVLVDREMWEKIVLNLLSNAFKFTFAGEIAVTLRQAEHTAELRVRDTGTGVPAAEIPRLFDRFYRVPNARGRTYEGSGIGLALVQELVRMHGGAIRAESVEGKGTTFTVTLPLGSAHLPPEQIGRDHTSPSIGARASSYVEEALRWLPDVEKASGERPAVLSGLEEDQTPKASRLPLALKNRPRVLVADDNADMRQYLVRLLGEQFQVEAVADGEAALAAARQRSPELVLTDVMMPRLDGFGLLRELRADPRTRSLPIIVLSARAGEESQVEGMEAGADDYLIKPFSFRELLARVSAHIQMAQLRREAGEALRTSEDRFHSFMTHSPVTAYIKDCEGRYVFVNRLTEQKFNRPLAEWIGKTDLDLFPPEQAEQFRANDRSVLDSCTTAQFVEPVNLEDGVHYYLSFKFPLADGDGCWLVAGMSLDITEQKRAEDDLRGAEARFRTLADNIPQLAWMTHADGHIFWYNRRWYEYTGTTFEQMEGWGWQSVHDPAELPRVVEKFKTRIASGEAWEDTFPLRGADGSYRWFLSRAVPIRDEQGRIVRWFGTNTDITEQRELEQALKDADRAKDEFLATLAHELRNPLAPLRNGLQLMKLAKNNVNVLEQARTMMERQLGQMVRLIDDLLDLSRVSRGKIALQKVRMPLATVVRNAVETSRPLIEQAGHELILDVPDEPIYVDADETRLSQVIANLLNNAAKYTERGGRIRLAVQRQGDDAVVVVEDNGVGIPAHLLPKVFDMFMQVDRSLERAHGGLGIGLNIVKRLVEMHGGSIQASSDGHGMGSRFVVRLPVVLTLACDQASEESHERVTRTARRRIVVVDDNRDAATSLAMMLSIMGNDTQTAHDGLEAVEVAAAFRPDVVLLDIGMPKLNGYEAARRIREQPWSKNMVLVALTGWGQEEDKRRSQEAGFDLHMVKPVEPATLDKLIAGLKAATN